MVPERAVRGGGAGGGIGKGLREGKLCFLCINHKHPYEKRNTCDFNMYFVFFVSFQPFNSCNSDDDCADTHCCAMKFGVQTCRRRAKPQQSCRPGSYDRLETDQLFSTCPCEKESRCLRMRNNPKKRVCVKTRR